jgi:GNAT superfamily N-acetyltransferase
MVKMMVHRDHQGRGLGARLMHAVEAHARAAGCRLLTLDTKSGSAAERLYRRLGWVHTGTIPRFAFDPDGKGLHGTEVFYKELA